MVEDISYTIERYMTDLSFLLIIVLSFFTGHIITAPAVSMIVTIIMLDLYRQDHKRILIVGDIKLSKKKLIVVKHEPIENNKIKLLIFKILNYKSFDYSYSIDMQEYYDNLPQYSKNKIHCSCPMCAKKTNNRGRHKYYGKGSKNWKHSDLIKIMRLDSQLTIEN